jgi:hypothetical protein
MQGVNTGIPVHSEVSFDVNWYGTAPAGEVRLNQ